MKQLTNSDLINIETFKALIKLTNEEIKDVKVKNAAESEKAKYIFKLHAQRAHLIQNATKNYPHIDWINEAEGPKSGFKQSLIETHRMKIENRLGLN